MHGKGKRLTNLDNPEGFKRLRLAYEGAMKFAGEAQKGNGRAAAGVLLSFQTLPISASAPRPHMDDTHGKPPNPPAFAWWKAGNTGLPGK